MDDRQPFTMAAEELTRLRQVVQPHIENIRQLEHDLDLARSSLQSILIGFLVGKGLKGHWSINCDSGLVTPCFSRNGTEEPLPEDQPPTSEGEANVSYQ